MILYKCDVFLVFHSFVAWPYRRGLYHWDGCQHEAIKGEHHSTGQRGVSICSHAIADQYTSPSFLCMDVLCLNRIFAVWTIWYAIWYILISPVALWPDHSHLPAAPVKEAEGQTCPPVPWTTSLWGLLLSTAPGNTGQAATPFILFLHQNFWVIPHLCLKYFLFPSFYCNCFKSCFILSQVRDTLHFSEDEDTVIVGSVDFRSDYIDDCPWVSVTQYTPQGGRGQPDGSSSRDMVREHM